MVYVVERHDNSVQEQPGLTGVVVAVADMDQDWWSCT